MSPATQRPELYFHVGLGKTGTTYLQYHFFPKLRGLRYIQRTRYKEYHSIIRNSKNEKLFFSREFDRQLEREVEGFAQHYPDTHAIIILRSPESWIASQYRRFVKNGFSGSFQDLIDVETDRGSWSREELLFSRKIEALDENFRKEPLVLLYDDLKKDPYAFFDRIASYCGVSYEREAIDLSPSHRSYNERQLKVMKRSAEKLSLGSRPERSRIKALKRIQEWSRRLLCYSILYSSILLPDSRIPDGPLIPDAELEKVKDFAAADWQNCVKRASNMPSIS